MDWTARCRRAGFRFCEFIFGSWQKEPPVEEASEPEFDPEFLFADFLFGIDAWMGNFEECWKAQKEAKERRFERLVNPDWMSRKNLPGLPPREYVFDEPEGHKPLAPKSALYRPPSLTLEEQKAVEVKQTIGKFLDGPKYELKPALKKKHREVLKGPRRVYFDAKGKMKEVKEGA